MVERDTDVVAKPGPDEPARGAFDGDLDDTATALDLGPAAGDVRDRSIEAGAANATQDDRLTVYFDGACPLCAKEIGFYRRRPGADDVCWVDISEAAGDVAPDLSFDTAMARFHVRSRDGSLESGGAAFSRLWSEMPGFRLIGRFTRLPPIAWLLERAYRFFLRFRPRLQRLAAGKQEATHG